MPELVAIVAEPGGFLRALLETWDGGDAVLPVDPRLPVAAVESLLAALRPARFVDGAGNRVTLPGAVPVEDGDALVVATSGTTGDPKGVVLTHTAVGASARATSARLGVDPGADSWLACLPLAHIGGLSVVTRALATGTPVEVAPAYDPATHATLVSLVPTVMERHDTSRFRAVLVGGSADWRTRAANAVHTYGMTETGSGVVYDGRPLDGVELRVADDGEIFLRGPMLLRGYRLGPAGTTSGPEVADPKDADGWLATGDLGELDTDGRLTVSGRAGDVIVTGGEKVWPDAVERVLRTAAGVEDVAVAGVPDAEWGQRVVAWVVPRDGSPPSLGSLRDVVKQSLPAYAAPKQILVVGELPRTPLGKLRRNLLVENC